jgi:shikimate dehydrogenase
LVRIDAHTALYGIIGSPLGHTLSPAVQNAAFRASGIDAVYLAFETTDPLTCLKAARVLPIMGLSVTIPFKSLILKHLDFVEHAAGRIGAVNTVVNRGGILRGYNTDAPAALEAIEAWADPEASRCLILGAGGAARAVGFALKDKCRKITIANRTDGTAKTLAETLGCHWTPLSEAHETEAELVINTTPVGMYPESDKCPISERALEHASVVMDIIYRPRRTALLEIADRLGCITIGGEEMFLRQASAQFSLWTGEVAPINDMTTAFEEATKGI